MTQVEWNPPRREVYEKRTGSYCSLKRSSLPCSRRAEDHAGLLEPFNDAHTRPLLICIPDLLS